MPFPHSVRDEALVAAARHCCVCHRYKGVKVEVHHIVPESKGGASDLDNAITLCFDCHADAGHYNPNHPRGTKFSPGELRRHRDEWHAIVRLPGVQSPDIPDVLYCRYLLCKSFDGIREITLGDLSNVPATQPLLVTNSVRVFQKKIIDAHPVSSRSDKEWGEHFPDREAYVKAHPEVHLDECSSIEGYPYFKASRIPLTEELRDKLAPRDGVTKLLIEAEVAPQNISHVFAYYEECGDNRIQEIYRLRPMWGLYLAATNLGPEQTLLSGITCDKDIPAGAGYRAFSTSLGQGHHVVEALPSAPLLPGATMLFPIATLLGPIENISPVTTFAENSDLPTGQVQVVSHEDLSTAFSSTALIGPVFWPHAVHIEAGAVRQEQQMHEFSLSNLYTINRHWEMGSCPHLFAMQKSSATLKYLRELFARVPGKVQMEHIIVSSDTSALLIAELEPEQTTIDYIRVNGKYVSRSVILEKGTRIWIPVQLGDVVELAGYYVAQMAGTTDPWMRNSLIHEFLEQAAPISS